MHYPVRTVGYSILVVATLTVLSVCVYRSPNQVRQRVERDLEAIVTVDVRAEGCRTSLETGLRVDSLVVPASRPVRVRDILTLDDVRRASSGATVLPSSGDPFAEDVPGRFFRAARGALSLEHEGPSPIRGSGGGWNFEGLFREEALRRFLEDEGLGFRIERLSVDLRPLGPSGGESLWSFTASRVAGRSLSPAGLVCRGDLLEGPSWSRGRLEIHWSLEKGLELEGRIIDFRGLDRWIGLLGEEHGAVWAPIAARSGVDVEIERWTPEAPSGDRLEAIVRHYDSTLELGRTGLLLEHLQGLMKLREGEVRFEEETGPAPRAELWGAEVGVSGTLAPDRGKLQVKLEGTRIRQLPVEEEASAGSRVLFLLGALHARALVEGGLDFVRRSADLEECSGHFRFEEAELPAFPLVRSFSGALSAERIWGGGDGSRGKGRIVLDAIRSPCLNLVRAEAPFSWSEEDVRVSVYLHAADPGDDDGEKPAGDGATAGAGPSAAAEPGSIFGSVVWKWREEALEVDLRSLGVELQSDLLVAEEVAGELHLAPSEDRARMEVHLGGVTIPDGLLWPEQAGLAFDSGRGLLEADTRGVRIRSLRLLGPKRSLRARGEIRVTGEVELLVFLVEGAKHIALHELAVESPPAAWLAAAPEDFRAFRISGITGSPIPREITGEDPAFLPKEEESRPEKP